MVKSGCVHYPPIGDIGEIQISTCLVLLHVSFEEAEACALRALQCDD